MRGLTPAPDPCAVELMRLTTKNKLLNQLVKNMLKCEDRPFLLQGKSCF